MHRPESCRSHATWLIVTNNLTDLCGSIHFMFQIRLATPDDFTSILDLLHEAAAWLATKGTNQWQQPWPGERERDTRIIRGLRAGQTWMVEENGRTAATVTTKIHGSEKLWNKDEQSSPACYICRLMVGREYAGQKLGEALVDWAAARAKAEYGAESIRIDVWTTNSALHGYYKERGFSLVRLCEDQTYPSAALFQKEIPEALSAGSPRLRETRALPATRVQALCLPVAPLVTACRGYRNRPESLRHPSRPYYLARPRGRHLAQPYSPTGSFQPVKHPMSRLTRILPMISDRCALLASEIYSPNNSF